VLQCVAVCCRKEPYSSEESDELIRLRRLLGITCVAVRCSVLQCVLQCVAVCVAVYVDSRETSPWYHVCCSVLQCAAVCCSEL